MLRTFVRGLPALARRSNRIGLSINGPIVGLERTAAKPTIHRHERGWF